MNATRFFDYSWRNWNEGGESTNDLKISDRVDELFSRHFSLSFARENAIRLSHGHWYIKLSRTPIYRSIKNDFPFRKWRVRGLVKLTARQSYLFFFFFSFFFSSYSREEIRLQPKARDAIRISRSFIFSFNDNDGHDNDDVDESNHPKAMTPMKKHTFTTDRLQGRSTKWRCPWKLSVIFFVLLNVSTHAHTRDR